MLLYVLSAYSIDVSKTRSMGEEEGPALRLKRLMTIKINCRTFQKLYNVLYTLLYIIIPDTTNSNYSTT